MNVKRKIPKTSSLSPADLKRLEEAFFTPLKETSPYKRGKNRFFIYALVSAGVLLVTIFYFKYTIIIVPKTPKTEDNLLSKHFLNSIAFTSNKNKAQFSQGILYLSLQPDTPQEIILNVKNSIDLEKNSLLLQFSLIEPIIKKGDLTLTVVVRNKEYRSTSLNPLTIVVDENIHATEDINLFRIPIIYSSQLPLHMNLSRIDQFRLGLLNSKNKPISLLIREIKLEKKEEK